MSISRPLTLLAVLVLSVFSAYCQTNCVPVFNTEYEAPGHLQPVDIKQLAGGDYLLAGSGSLSSADPQHGMVLKISAIGDVLWSYILSSGTGSAYSGIALLANGDYLLYGVLQNDSYPEGKPLLTRITSAGVSVWSRLLLTNQSGKDRIKGIKELSNGDFIGIMNQNDSSSQSNAIVFRSSSTGNVLWVNVFDNGADDSFTSLTIDNGIVYVGGHYTSGYKRGVMVTLSESGSILSSTNITNRNDVDEYMDGLEVKNGLISYGLRQSNYDTEENVVLMQETMGGQTVFSRLGSLFQTNADTKLLRTPDQGFMILRMHHSWDPNAVTKIDRYGAQQWSRSLGPYYIKNNSFAMDLTADGGSIAASYFKVGISPISKMRILRTDKYGNAGTCTDNGNGIHFDTGSVSKKNLNWVSQSGNNNLQSLPASITATAIVISKSETCAESICVDAAPLPPGCGKTYRIEYSSGKNLILRDVITASDGGKIAVGNLGLDNGGVVKYNINGDVAWAKSYEEFFHTSNFMRILRSADNNLFVFSNDAFTVNHGGSFATSVIKMNNNGDVLWSKNFMFYYNSQILDVVSTPDNGFALMITEGYGSGSTFAQLLRFDAAGSIVWKKELKYSFGTPLYKSLSCNANYIYAAHESYASTPQERFGVDKFSLQTGDKVWSKRYSVADGSVIHINRIFNINDTAYVFLNHFDPVDFFNPTYNTVMLKLNPDGKINQSFTINANQAKLPDTYYIWDQSPPTVTLTPDFDFVMANKVYDGNADGFNISRFTKEGVQVWSRNYNDLAKYSPLNIHPQGNGFIVVGTIETGVVNLNKSFLLKVDSAGLLESGAQCAPENTTLTKFNTKFNPEDSLIENIIEADIKIWDSEILSQPESVDATQYCHEIDNCGNVGFLQKGNGCSLTDTLVYYLLDPQNCDAAATWQYDPTFFKPLSVDAYSLQLMPLKKGTSHVKAIVEGNCTLTEKNITASILLSASEMNLGRDTVMCNNQNIRLSAGVGYATYLWNDISNSADSIITVSDPGVYSVTVTDNCGNSKTDSIVVADVSTTFELTNDTTRCNDETIVLTATPGLSNYEWLPQYAIQPADNKAAVKPATNTKYFVTAKTTAGCLVTDSVNVTAIRTPQVTLGNDTTLCEGDTYLISAGSDFDSYIWNKGQTTNAIIVNEQGDYSVKAIKDGCASYDTLRVLEIKPLPDFTLGNDTSICENEFLKYNFTLPSALYTWSNGSTSGNISLSVAGNYWLKITQRGCVAYDTVSITTRPAPLVFIGNDTILCEGEAKLLSPGNNGSYLWQNGSTANNYLVNQTGDYWVSITENNCSTKDSINIKYLDAPLFTLGRDTTLCNGMEIRLTPKVNDPDAFYSWHDQSTLPYYVVNKEGIYTLTVNNKCGYYSDSILITPGICNLIMPNTFTPDNNGLNDLFRVKYVFPAKQFVFTIFNRWGYKVFETNDMTKGWDGNYKGIAEPAGVFVWKIFLLDGEGNTQNANGMVTLIR